MDDNELAEIITLKRQMEDADRRSAESRKRRTKSARELYVQVGLYDFLTPKVTRKEVVPHDAPKTSEEHSLDELSELLDDL